LKEQKVQEIRGVNMDVNEVAAELAKHEAVCAERWKTIFNKIEAMEKGADGRFTGIDNQVSRIETILISVSGTLIVAGAGIIWTMFSMHS
jgi:hypothetical protein